LATWTASQPIPLSRFATATLIRPDIGMYA
jgi:hypothetical protein